MHPTICPHLGRRRGTQRETPIPTPSGKNCCYARLPNEEPATSMSNWLSKLGLTARDSNLPCMPAGRGHQSTFCLTAEHTKCKLYHPPKT
jgi:hypothetical protein